MNITNNEINEIKRTSQEEQSSDKVVKYMRIAIAILMVLAIILACFVIIPPSGSLGSEVTEADFSVEGDAIRVRASILNNTNKPAFNVNYEIIVTDDSGNILGTVEDHAGFMLPGGKRKVEKFINFDTKVETGNVEIIVNGYVIGE